MENFAVGLDAGFIVNADNASWKIRWKKKRAMMP